MTVTRRLVSLWPELLITLLVFVVYAHSLGNVFVDLDDQLLIIHNEIAHGLHWQNIKAAFSTYDPELYIPFTLLTYQLEYTLFGLNPHAIHTTSLLLHILSAILVLKIFRELFPKHITLVLALLFALHPINTETVSWASGRKDILSSLFFLISTWTYLRWKRTAKGYWSSVAAFGCGLLAKVSIFPLPAILILLDILQGRTLDRKSLQEKLPFVLLATLFLIIAIFGKSQVGHLQTWVTLSLAAVPFYLSKYLLPLHLSALYPFTGSVNLLDPQILTGTVILLLLTITVIVSLKKTRVILYGALWFALLLIPSLPTVIKGGEDGAILLYLASDRYVYLAGLGLLYLLGCFLNHTRIWNIGRWLSISLIGIFCLLTYRQSLVWRDSVSLYENVIHQDRPAHMAYLSLGRISAERGNFDLALDLYAQSHRLHPSSKALLNIGQIHELEGRKRDAIIAFEQVLLIWPDLIDITEKVAALYRELGEPHKALPFEKKASELRHSAEK